MFANKTIVSEKLNTESMLIKSGAHTSDVNHGKKGFNRKESALVGHVG